LKKDTISQNLTEIEEENEEELREDIEK